MKVEVDFDLCESNAVCVEVCPEVFSIDKDDYLVIATDAPLEPLREKLEKAAVACPRQAITIED